MNALRIALWVLGPIGSGKTTLLANNLPSDFRLVDQDGVLEQELAARGLPLDTRMHNAAQSAEFTAIRREVTDSVWAQVPEWRAKGLPLAFEVTGDKPLLLQIEVEADRAAGYRSIGVGLRCPLATCVQRNRERPRVLPDSVVESTWQAFERNLANQIYATIFGPDAFVLTSDSSEFDLAACLRTIRSSPP
jgi:predicted kinase